MSSQGQITLCSSEPKRPKSHSSDIYNISGIDRICPQTGRPYVVHQRVHPEEKGDRMVMVEEFTCSECDGTIKKWERDPHITYV